MNTINSLLDKIEKAKALDFGTIFNQSIELFKKVWVQGLVMLLLTMLLMIPFYLIMYLPMLGMGLIDPQSFQNMGDVGDFRPLLMIPFFIFVLVFLFLAMVIGFGMKASFYRICKLKDLEEMGADDYFYYLKKPYLGKVIKLSLATFGISMAATLLCFFPIIYVMIPVALMNVIFAFNPDLSTSEIVKAGFKLGNKKWLLTFGLLFVSAILAEIIGLLMCCIGILVTASFVYLPAYFIYKDSIGFDEKEGNDVYEVSHE
ncbi:hypothetical protein QLS71_004160 [Mariniflexile litorale]|uniref:Glycerophosphoryl diester phosphodiesterase membrane domain-containing protein n=1 Tax=Mariniflexile litorale TaxID=3045158 RepID=A0AAU7EHW2_9FLAO|nr:hypothetical protein [Mariniflexile sp. KMM 9835]MDQ8210214.1 hypothetical protein [Mariniflexile sp. KMM 9835]